MVSKNLVPVVQALSIIYSSEQLNCVAIVFKISRLESAFCWPNGICVESANKVLDR
jgi:hypothetical protein